MAAMEAAPQLKASGLDGDYRILTDFSGTVLAGTPSKHGVQFVTWDWDYDRTGVVHGHYFMENYDAAKQDFATRSGLIQKEQLFSPEQLTEIFRCCADSVDEDFFELIITAETFERVQKLIQARKQNYGKTPSEMIHRLSPKVVCGCCGTMFRRKPQRGKYYWCCIKHDENREKCHITPITEQSIYEAFCRLYYKLKHQSRPILEQMLETLRTIRDRRLLWSEDIVSLNKKISELSSQNQTLAFLKQNGLVDPDIFISKSNELTRQLRQAKLDKEELMAAEGDATAQRTQELIALLEDGPDFLDHPDTELCGALIAEIIVESNDTLRFRLHNGLELRESIERTVR